MPRFFAFLRAINAGPGRTVRMKVLCEVFESLNFSGVATFLASGNVVFETKAKDSRTLEKRIERRLRDALGYHVPVFLRTDAELKEIATLEPFGRSQLRGAGVNVIFLADNLDEGSKAKATALRSKTDEFRIRGREIYWWRRRKPGTSVFSTVPLEKVLREPFRDRRREGVGKSARATDEVVASDVTAVVLKETGHWVLEERPKETTDALVRFL